MPFRKVNPEEEIKKAIKNNPELSKEMEKAEKEYEELKAKGKSTMEYKMSGDLLKTVLGDKGTNCYICGDDNKLKTCKACKLTICEECMSNEDLCQNCMHELETTGGFDTYTSYEFEHKMYDKYIKQN